MLAFYAPSDSIRFTKTISYVKFSCHLYIFIYIILKIFWFRLLIASEKFFFFFKRKNFPRFHSNFTICNLLKPNTERLIYKLISSRRPRTRGDPDTGHNVLFEFFGRKILPSKKKKKFSKNTCLNRLKKVVFLPKRKIGKAIFFLFVASRWIYSLRSKPRNDSLILLKASRSASFINL